jgi:hypothetical protein
VPAASSPTFLAVAVAASMDDEADAMRLARQARGKKPDRALAQKYNDGKVAQILAEVNAAQDDSTKQYNPTDEQRSAAAAVGADARLIAAAAAAINRLAVPAVGGVPVAPDPAHPENNSGGWNARRWAIRLLDLGVADRAALAGAQAEAQDTFSSATQAKNLQKQIDKLNAAIDERRAAVDAREEELTRRQLELDVVIGKTRDEMRERLEKLEQFQADLEARGSRKS